MMQKILSFLLVLLLCGWTVQVPNSPYTGPGDIVAYTAWYGLRAYSNAKAAAGTTKMVRIRNTSSNELCDVLAAANGGLGLTTSCTSTGAGQTVSAFCGGVDCKIHTMYDQTAGNACASSTTCNIVQATNGSQPTLSASDSYNVAISTGSTAIIMNSTNNFNTTISVPVTVTGVGNKTGQFDVNIMAASGNNYVINGRSAAANSWTMFGFGAGPTVTASDSNWHSAVGVAAGNGASGICLSTSCAAFTGNTGTATDTGKAQILGLGNASAVDRFREGGWIYNHASSASEANSLNTNASGYWGFTPP